MKRVLAFVAIACITAPAHSSDAFVQHKGRCQSLTMFDRNVSGKCPDSMIVQTGDTGERGFLFHLADESVVFFIAIDAPAAPDGTRILAVSRIDFGLRGQVESIAVGKGQCRSVDPSVAWRAETVCETETFKGRFAVQFVTINGAVEAVKP